ncbi:TPA: hypothetical protein KC759_000027 [Escherichia coli O146]|nr:hypothetical protein [Escherichia coli O146]HBC3062780.1 hypothetical protein [Escherichia coli O146]HBC3157633.1 hypothetical protein [Escherichia coli O146]
MSEINYQALREAAVAIETVATPQKLLAFRMKATPQVVLALLNELEAAKSKLNEQREYYEGVIADGSKRIAELESRSQAQKLVEAIIVAIENEQERLFDEDYLMDSKECIDVIREEVKRWNDSRAPGIRIKGE